MRIKKRIVTQGIAIIAFSLLFMSACKTSNEWFEPVNEEEYNGLK